MLHPKEAESASFDCFLTKNRLTEEAEPASFDSPARIGLKQLHKTADLIFTLPIGSEVWPEEMFDLLLIGVVFPFLSFSAWQLKGTPKMLSLGRKLTAMWKIQR